MRLASAKRQNTAGSRKQRLLQKHLQQGKGPLHQPVPSSSSAPVSLKPHTVIGSHLLRASHPPSCQAASSRYIRHSLTGIVKFSNKRASAYAGIQLKSLPADVLRRIASSSELSLGEQARLACVSRSTRSAVSDAKALTKHLNLSRYRLSVDDKVLRHLSFSFPNLSSLSVRDCSLVSDAGIRQLQRCRALRTLDLSYNQGVSHCTILADTLESLLFNLPKLHSLHLSHCRAVNSLFLGSAFKPSSLLRVLTMRHCPNIDGSAVELIADNAPHLQKLDVSYCPIPSSSVGSLSKCQALQILGLSFSRLNSLALRKLSTLQSLQALDISGTAVSSTALADVLHLLPRLTFLDVSWCTDVSSLFISRLTVDQPRLSPLTLRMCHLNLELSARPLVRLLSSGQVSTVAADGTRFDVELKQALEPRHMHMVKHASTIVCITDLMRKWEEPDEYSSDYTSTLY